MHATAIMVGCGSGRSEAMLVPVPLAQAVRARAPERLRNHPGLRAVALASGLIPPRVMHTAAEADLLRGFANGAACVVELGVYEGSSAVTVAGVMGAQSELHLVDPFVDESGWSMLPGWQGTPRATMTVVRRACRRGGPQVHWHVARSQDVGRAWSGRDVDLVFIDGDHSPAGCREDWEVWHPHVAPGGVVAFHDARWEMPAGRGSPGPTGVVAELFLESGPPTGWSLVAEIDSVVAVRRSDPRRDEDRPRR